MKERIVSRSVWAILAAWAVLWHAVVGCCAHHAHAGLVAYWHDHAQAIHALHVESVDEGCSSHCEHTGQLSSETEFRVEDLATSSGDSHRCPCDEPSPCSETRCVFVASDSPTLQTLSGFVPPDMFLDDALLHVTSAARSLRSSYPLELAPSLDCALRRHLALGVMLI